MLEASTTTSSSSRCGRRACPARQEHYGQFMVLKNPVGMCSTAHVVHVLISERLLGVLRP